MDALEPLPSLEPGPVTILLLYPVPAGRISGMWLRTIFRINECRSFRRRSGKKSYREKVGDMGGDGGLIALDRMVI